MHVRIDQSGYEKLPAPVDSPCLRTRNQFRADLNDLAVANDDICTKQRGGAFRRNQSDSLDHHALINNALRMSDRPNIENEQRSQYSDKQWIAHERPVLSRYLSRHENYTNLPPPKFR